MLNLLCVFVIPISVYYLVEIQSRHFSLIMVRSLILSNLFINPQIYISSPPSFFYLFSNLLAYYSLPTPDIPLLPFSLAFLVSERQTGTK